MKIGFTGSQYAPMTPAQAETVFLMLETTRAIDKRNRNVSEFHHGCNEMRDSEAARMARSLGYRLCGHPPTNKSKIGDVINDFDYPEAPYLFRNHILVDEVEFLIAAPLTRRIQLRSGTGATCRYAVKRNREGRAVMPLDGLAVMLVDFVKPRLR